MKHFPFEVGFRHTSFWDADKKFIAAAAGTSHTILLDDQGHVRGVGNNTYGQLGYPSNGHDEMHPHKIPLDHITTVAIAAGSEHSVLLDDKGKVFTFGSDFQGQLGHGNASSGMGIGIKGL